MQRSCMIDDCPTPLTVRQRGPSRMEPDSVTLRSKAAAAWRCRASRMDLMQATCRAEAASRCCTAVSACILCECAAGSSALLQRKVEPWSPRVPHKLPHARTCICLGINVPDCLT